MKKCIRCGEEFRFFEGFVTLKGMICRRCREVGEIEKALKEYDLSREPEKLAREILARGCEEEVIEKLGRLAELEPKRHNVIVGRTAAVLLAKEDLRSEIEKEVCAEEFAQALEVAFAIENRPVFLKELVFRGQGGVVENAFLSEERPIEEEWLEVPALLAERNDSQRAIRLLGGMHGTGNRRFLEILECASTNETASEVEKILRRIPVMGAEFLAEFLGRLQERVAAGEIAEKTLKRLSAAVRERFRGGKEEIKFIRLWEGVEGVREYLEDADELTSGMMLFLEQEAESIGRPEILRLLHRIRIPSDLRERVAVLIGRRIDEPEQRRVALEIFERCEDWPRIREIVEEGANEEERERWRERCKVWVRATEQKHQIKLAGDLEAILRGGDVGHLRGLFCVTGNAGHVSRLSSLALRALWSAARHRTARDLRVPFLKWKKAASVRKGKESVEPVAEEALIDEKKSIVKILKELISKDGIPHFIIPVARVGEKEKWEKLAEEFALVRRELDRYGENPIEAKTGERELFFHAARAVFARFLIRVAGNTFEGSPEYILLQRPYLYGVLFRALMAPEDPGNEQSERVGSRELCIDTGIRAIAFMPKVRATSETHWSEFLFAFGGELRHLGIETTGIQRLEEYRPAWWEDICADPDDKEVEKLDHIPFWDSFSPLKKETVYRAREEEGRREERSDWSQE